MVEAALRFLETRQRSIAEVRRRLTTAGYRSDLVETAIDRLLALEILDDDVFARAWIESRDRASPRGEHALMLELRVKGIDPTIIAAALRERREAAIKWDSRAGDEGDSGEAGESALPDEVAARALLVRRARALERVPDPRARRQKAYALLARNGFSPDVASAAAREWASTASEDKPPLD